MPESTTKPIINLLPFWADCSSIIGLIITLFVLKRVGEIQRRFMFTARVPDLKSKLSGKASKLIELQADFENKFNEIHTELARIEVHLNSLNKKVNKENRVSIKEALRLIRDYRKEAKKKNTGDENKLSEIYTQLQKIIEEINELIKDSEWERTG